MRFNEEARKVVFYAQEEAQKAGIDYVAPEDLLLGVIRDSECVGATVLKRLSVSLSRLRADLVGLKPPGDQHMSQDMTLTPRCKHIINLADDEAKSLGHKYIGSEHLLLGLIRETKGLAAQVLAERGIELMATRDACSKLLAEADADQT